MMGMAVPEMDRYLKQLVESALEESQFENAISLLDQIRSEDHSPSPILLLHVIFISLHSTSLPSRLDDPTEPVIDHATLLGQSPRKIMKHSKSSILLGPAVVVAAHRLLHAYIRTNGPHALAPAIPLYPESKNSKPFEFEYIDSPVHPQAVAIKNARSVWDVVKSDFVIKTYRASLAAHKGRAKQARASALARDVSFTDWAAQEDVLPVAEHSWHTLDWLVALFEADAQHSAHPKYSSLLLKQLPPPPIGSHTRWDASEPLRVVFSAFKQKDPRRQRTGLRLLTLLLDLTHARQLNLQAFASTTLAQMSVEATTHTHTHQAILTDLLSRLASSPPALVFKITLCTKILSLLAQPEEESAQAGIDPPPLSAGSVATIAMSMSMSMSESAASLGGVPTSPAKPRIRPRPLPRKVADAGGASSAEKGKGKKTGQKEDKEKGKQKALGEEGAAVPPPPPVQIRIPLPPLAEIARLVRLHAPASLPTTCSLPTPRIPASSSSSPLSTPTDARSNSDQNTSPTSKGKGKTQRSGGGDDAPAPAPPRESEEPQSPWTSPPSLLLRVKFELVRAWIVGRGMKGMDGENGEEEAQREREDKELRALIADVFGSGGVAEQEKEGKGDEDEVYKKDRAFYRDALDVFLSMGR